MEEYFDDCERNDIELEGIEVLDKALEYVAFEFLSDKPPKPKKPWTSDSTLNMITEKRTLDRNGDSLFLIKEKRVKKALRSGWKQWAENKYNRKKTLTSKTNG